ncbi:hypothetical protein [Thermaurantiacus sp.]
MSFLLILGIAAPSVNALLVRQVRSYSLVSQSSRAKAVIFIAPEFLPGQISLQATLRILFVLNEEVCREARDIV